MTASVMPADNSIQAPAYVRSRWHMGFEARVLVLLTAALVCFGLAALYSASALQALREGRPGHFFVLRQAGAAVFGFVILIVLTKIDAELWKKVAWVLVVISLMLMVVVMLDAASMPPLNRHPSRRYLFGGSVQPSELAKFAILIWVPMMICKKGKLIRSFKQGLLPFGIVVGAMSILAALEPDWSVALMFWALLAVLLFVGGMRISHFLLVGVVALMIGGVAYLQGGYVRSRIDSFLTRVQSEQTVSGMERSQEHQSEMAVGVGGILGVGFGRGNQQRGWLPLAYNDFIGSVVGEEFGFVGIAGLTMAFVLYGWLGFRIAKKARSSFLMLLAVGLTFTMVLTAFVHLGVVVGLLPNTGLTLPFISYGRSNLLLSLVMTGILVNIGSERQRVPDKSARTTEQLSGIS